MNAVTVEILKAVALLVVTDEVIKSASNVAQTFITNELRRAVAAAVDAAFLDRITDTSTAVIASDGITALNAGGDLTIASRDGFAGKFNPASRGATHQRSVGRGCWWR
jgi:hypothetical protein